MSSEIHAKGHATGAPGAEPKHADVSFEATDVHAGTIYKYLFALALAVVFSYVVCVFVLRLTTSVAVQSDTPPPPVRQEMGKGFKVMPPEPRLQGMPGHGNDPQADMREKLRLDLAENDKIGWIDQTTGIAQIPVKDAMKLIVEKGLPAVSAPPAEQKK
jgi:hypothetical protein